MVAKIPLLGLALFLAISGWGKMRQFLAALDTKPQLEAWAPKIAFPRIEATAVDALIYTYRRQRRFGGRNRGRGGRQPYSRAPRADRMADTTNRTRPPLRSPPLTHPLPRNEAPGVVRTSGALFLRESDYD
jgi:hypothetical protein